MTQPRESLTAEPHVTSARDAWIVYGDQAIAVLRQKGLQPPWGFPQPNDPPLRHSGSQAQYVLEYRWGRSLVLAQYTAPHSVSSIHYHPEGVTEEFFQIAGGGYLNGIPIPKNGRVIPPGLIHQVWTRDSFSFTAIIMQGVDGLRDEQMHIRLHPELVRPWLGRSAFDPEFERVRDTLILGQ